MYNGKIVLSEIKLAEATGARLLKARPLVVTVCNDLTFKSMNGWTVETYGKKNLISVSDGWFSTWERTHWKGPFKGEIGIKTNVV